MANSCYDPPTPEPKPWMPKEWAVVICGGLGWQHSEGDLTNDELDQAKPLLRWIAENYPEVAERYCYLPFGD